MAYHPTNELRWLKKADGTRVLQQKWSESAYERHCIDQFLLTQEMRGEERKRRYLEMTEQWRDVPEVEE